MTASRRGNFAIISRMPPPQDFTLHQHDGVSVVALQLESLLGVLEVNRIGAELTALVDGGARRLVVDLKKVKFAGSAGLGMLLGLSSDLKSRGGKLVLVNTQHIEPLLKVTRARSAFHIAPDTLSAMEAAKA